MTPLSFQVDVDGTVRRLALEHRGEGWVAQIDGRSVPVDVCEPTPGMLSLLIGEEASEGAGHSEENGAGGRSYRCVRVILADEESIAVGSRQHRIAVSDPRSLRGRRKRGGAGNGMLQVKASMPGRVARVLVAPGEVVVAQQGIMVIEAMKMQNELKAARDGRIAEVRVAAGDKVASGQVLAVLE
jgi:biotin carboxyl carrier protein